MGKNYIYLFFQIGCTLWISTEIWFSFKYTPLNTSRRFEGKMSPFLYFLPFAAIFLIAFDASLNFSGLAFFLSSSFFATILGFALFYAGIGLRSLARFYLKDLFANKVVVFERQTIVRRGVYAYLRHPLYTGLLLINLGVPLIFSSLWGLFYWLFLFLPLVLLRVKEEEKVLTRYFKNDYLDYKADTWGVLPQLKI